MTRLLLAILLAAAFALLAGLLLGPGSLAPETAEFLPIPGADDPDPDPMQVDRVLRVEPTTGPGGTTTGRSAASPLAASPAGHIGGVVVDPDGRAVPFATVEVEGIAHEADADGRFQAAAASVVRVRARHETGRSGLVLARPGGAPLRLVVRNGTRLAVRVRRPGGFLTPDIAVVVTSGEGVARGTLDASNPVRFDDLPAGLLRIEAIGPHALARAQVVRLTKGRAHEVTLDLVSAPGFAGTVTSTDGSAPIAGATVQVSGMGFPVVTIATDAEGRFAVPAVAPDAEITVQVHASGFRGFRQVYAPAAKAQHAAIRLERADDVRGYVVDPQGNPVAGARVHLVSGTNAPVFRTRTDDAGAYALPRPAADDPFAQVLAVRGFAWAAVAADTLAADGTLPALGLLPAGQIAGSIAGLPEDATLRLRPEVGPLGNVAPLRPESLSVAHGLLGGAGSVAHRDAEGRFRFDPVPAGVYRLEVVTAEGTLAPLRELVVRGEVLDLGALSLEGARLAGTVTDLAGRPLAGAAVMLQQDDDRAGARQLVTDADGRFALLGLPEDTYRVFVSLPGYGPRRTLVQVPATSALTIELGETVSLRGHVADRDGAVNGTATIQLHDLLTGSEHARTRRVEVVGGRFRLTSVRAGEYRVVLRMDDGRTEDAGVIAVLPGHEEELHIAL